MRRCPNREVPSQSEKEGHACDCSRTAIVMGAINFEKIMGLTQEITRRYGSCSLPAEEAGTVIAGVGETITVPEVLQMLDDILQHGSLAH